MEKEYEYNVSFDDYAEDITSAMNDIMNILDDIRYTECGEEFAQRLLDIENEIDELSSDIYAKRERYMSEKDIREERELRSAVSNGFLYD